MTEEQEAIRDLVAAIDALDWFVRRVPVAELCGQNHDMSMRIIEQARAARRRGRGCLKGRSPIADEFKAIAIEAAIAEYTEALRRNLSP